MVLAGLLGAPYYVLQVALGATAGLPDGPVGPGLAVLSAVITLVPFIISDRVMTARTRRRTGGSAPAV
jgi:hypothetical protein